MRNIVVRIFWDNGIYHPQVLAQNKVPVSCAVYADDMFVDMDISRATLKQIANSTAWITNEYEHNGLRADGERILDKLVTMGDQIAANIDAQKANELMTV